MQYLLYHTITRMINLFNGIVCVPDVRCLIRGSLYITDRVQCESDRGVF
jgi:hypothetical protein